MKTISAISILLSALACTMAPASAQSYVEPVRIARLAVDNQGIAFMQLSTRPPYTGRPACATSTGWDFIFPASTEIGQTLLSMALTSRMNQPLLRIVGTGTCLQNIELVAVIDILAN